jgi:hypothetical protein
VGIQPSARYWPWILSFLLGCLLVYCAVNSALTAIRIAFADEQTAIFEEMRRKVKDSDAVDVGPLEYVVWYYPSGTKQTVGSRLDRVVERARQSAVREIIAILRDKTDRDFGDDPRRWIEGLKAPDNR